jgi:hypothetical protein
LAWKPKVFNGGGNMPAFGDSLKPRELDTLVAFLEPRKPPLRLQDPLISAVAESKIFFDNSLILFFTPRPESAFNRKDVTILKDFLE